MRKCGKKKNLDAQNDRIFIQALPFFHFPTTRANVISDIFKTSYNHKSEMFYTQSLMKYLTSFIGKLNQAVKTSLELFVAIFANWIQSCLNI